MLSGEGEMDVLEKFRRQIQQDLVMAGLKGLREENRIKVECVSSTLIGYVLMGYNEVRGILVKASCEII